ncbi:TetR family transcriptional regulator [Dyella jejuensis]|uniref:TetR family transcriptional regulator n=1 Tax=Dyella jejuensis TaxID=1432009 RepID=A0ABW8JM54_9GAMM
MSELSFPDASEGRRGRKRRETRERIAKAAIKLFLRDGYDATTVEAIAEAADVSRRSLFHYFPAKEDVLFANQENFLTAVVDEIRKRPADEPWPVLIERAIAIAIADAASPENIAIDALVRRTPALQSRHQLKYLHLERAIAVTLGERTSGAKTLRARAELLAAVVVAGFRIAAQKPGDESVRDSGNTRHDVEREFHAFWKSLRDFGEAGLGFGNRLGVRPLASRRSVKKEPGKK